MIQLVVKSTLEAGAKRVIVVIGYKGHEVKNCLKSFPVETAVQFPPAGTGDAVRVASRALNLSDDNIVILCGDVPLLTSATIQNLLSNHLSQGADATILVARTCFPMGYGRLIMKDDNFEAIVEERDCSREQKRIQLVNAGAYCVKKDILDSLLCSLPFHKDTKEYYFTDLFGLLKERGGKVAMVKTENFWEVQSVNYPEDLLTVKRLIGNQQLEYSE